MTRNRLTAVVAAVLLSKLGNQALLLVVPLTFVARGTASEAFVTFAASTLPWLFGPLFGPFIDKYPVRLVYRLSELVQAVCVTALALLILRGSGNLLAMCGLLLLTSCGAVVSGISFNFVILPRLDPTNQSLQRLNATFITGSQLVAVLGLPLVAALVPVFGAPNLLALDAGTFAFTIWASLVVPAPTRMPADIERGYWSRLGKGFHDLFHAPRLRLVSAFMFLSNLGAGALTIVVLSAAYSTWHLGATGSALAMGIGGLGSAGGVIVAGWSPLSRWTRHPEAHVSAGMVVIVGGAAAMVAVADSPWALIGYGLFSFGEGFCNLGTTLIRQREIPTESAGRINTVIRSIALGALPLSSLGQAALVDLGVRSRMLPVLVFSVMSAGVWVCLPRSRTVDTVSLEV